MIRDYQIVEETGKDSFEQAVSDLILEGWEPIGRVSVDGRYYAQAMVLRDLGKAIHAAQLKEGGRNES